MVVECLYCHKTFETTSKNRKYCDVCVANRVWKKGIPAWNSGKTGIYSDEQRKNLSQKSHDNNVAGLTGFQKGHKHSRATIDRISQSKKGKPSWNKGLKHSDEHSKNLSIAQKKRFEKEPPWNKGGGEYSKETREKMSKSHQGNVPWNKGKTFSAESRRKMRLARLEVIKRSVFEGGQVRPAYNTTACRFFGWFDKQYNTTGQYATKGGEYFIEELGYFVDYFNPEMRVIIEWDEEHGHYRNGKLREKDIRRQEEIMRHLPDYELLRIREKHFDVSQLSEVA